LGHRSLLLPALLAEVLVRSVFDGFETAPETGPFFFEIGRKSVAVAQDEWGSGGYDLAAASNAELPKVVAADRKLNRKGGCHRYFSEPRRPTEGRTILQSDSAWGDSLELRHAGSIPGRRLQLQTSTDLTDVPFFLSCRQCAQEPPQHLRMAIGTFSKHHRVQAMSPRVKKRRAIQIGANFVILGSLQATPLPIASSAGDEASTQGEGNALGDSSSSR